MMRDILVGKLESMQQAAQLERNKIKAIDRFNLDDLRSDLKAHPKWIPDFRTNPTHVEFQIARYQLRKKEDLAKQCFAEYFNEDTPEWK